MYLSSCLALLLAGGEGKRLAPLTVKRAKPAVPFASRHRIVDFALSNCVHSGITSIGILTQYCAETLHDYLKDSHRWSENGHQAELFTLEGGVDTSMTYTGTANAIYQNIERIDRLAPENVIILSGDHIYTMDYTPMLRQHVENNANATVAVKEVPWKDASRFGIVGCDADSRMTSFIEKPDKPTSNLASMGIYVFNWRFLREKLILDAAKMSSSHDFGKDVLPGMLEGGASIQVYRYNGYWQDVGTLESYWQSHMDVLEKKMDLERNSWPIHTFESAPLIEEYLSPYTTIRESLVHSSSVLEGKIERTFLYENVEIGRGSEISESLILPGARIGRNVRLHRCIIGENTVVEDGAVIGKRGGPLTVLDDRKVAAAKRTGAAGRSQRLA